MNDAITNTMLCPSTELARLAAGQLELILAPDLPEPPARPASESESESRPAPRPGSNPEPDGEAAPAPRPRRDAGSARSGTGVGRRSGRMGAARWWFARMRDAVRTARDWPVAEERWGGEVQSSLPLAATPTRFERRDAGNTAMAA